MKLRLLSLAAIVVLAAALGYVLGRRDGPPAEPAESAPAPAPETVARPPAALQEPARAASGEREAPALERAHTLAPQDAARGARIVGRVIDEAGQAVGGALLLLGEDPIYPLADAREVGRTRSDGTLELDGALATPERHVVYHLFACSGPRLGWERIAVRDEEREVRLPDIVLVPTTRLAVSVLDGEGRSVAGASVEARARFYPFLGLFDGAATGLRVHPAVQQPFRAETDRLGNAVFEHLPAPHASGIYEIHAEHASAGAGQADLLHSGAGPAADVVVQLRRER